MKTSIIFIILLVTVSCSIHTTDDAAFIQLTNDPRAEAVLATIALQMTQNNGFLKVQSLLTDLLNGARKNLHNNRKSFKKAQARCDIFTHRYQEKDEYFQTLVESFNGEKVTLNESKKRAGEAVRARTQAVVSYKKFQTEEKTRFQEENVFYNDVTAIVSHAQSSIAQLLASLKSQNKLRTSFIQQNVQTVTEAYEKVFNLSVDIPSSLIQLSLDNNSARLRVISWLEDINMTFAAMITGIARDSNVRVANSQSFNGLLTTIIANLEADSRNISELKSKYVKSISEFEKNIKDFGNFRTTNHASLVENTNYCKNEKNSYDRVSKNSKGNVRIYEELLVYFNENFRKVSNMIYKKYNVLK